ncbi:hypothetical protein JOC86_003811 [Bacillus pakistanensis]|uniref:Uncharacterized protein n=1 Tax=Rossellomorea pakistanensis TaxID=992288 RepID=A0ABS2NHE2_9BACI|nr:hypothetical protein [Bacillus pakistanensis]
MELLLYLGAYLSGAVAIVYLLTITFNLFIK